MLDPSRAGPLAAAALWAVLAAPVVAWTARGFLDDDGPVRAVIAVAAAWSALRGSPSPSDEPAGWAPMAWVAAGVGAGLVGPPLDVVHGVAVVLAGYGVLGLSLPASRWRALGAAVPLGLLTLPVGGWVDAILGWPLRTGVAAAAATILGGVPTATVIAVEGGLASVDLPCAGLRSLWVGAAALSGWALARRRPLDLGLAVAALAFVAAMLGANVARVVVIVGLAHRLGLPLLAETVHQPLGLVGFALAGAAAAGVLALVPPVARPRRVGEDVASRPGPDGRHWLAAAAMVLLLARPPQATPEPLTPVALPAGWEARDGTDAERAFAREHGAATTHGRDPARRASLVLVRSRSWLAQHVPVRCLRAAGWTVERERAAEVGGHWVRVADVARDGRRATAVWWFQQGDRITDDVVVRIGDGLRGGAPWVLVSLLVEDPGIAPAVVDEVFAEVRASGRTGRGA